MVDVTVEVNLGFGTENLWLLGTLSGFLALFVVTTTGVRLEVVVFFVVEVDVDAAVVVDATNAGLTLGNDLTISDLAGRDFTTVTGVRSICRAVVGPFCVRTGTDLTMWRGRSVASGTGDTSSTSIT